MYPQIAEDSLNLLYSTHEGLMWYLLKGGFDSSIIY